MKYKSEQDLMEELYESIFSGNLNGDSEDEEKDEKSEGAEEDEEESEEEEKGEDESGSLKAGGAFKSQVKSLQRQYNDLLIDAFEKYSPECIESALDEVKSAFGENIEDILDLAMNNLKEKILGDLGIENLKNNPIAPEAMGSFNPAAGKNIPMEIEIS